MFNDETIFDDLWLEKWLKFDLKEGKKILHNIIKRLKRHEVPKWIILRQFPRIKKILIKKMTFS